MNDNNAYIVQCTQANFDSALTRVQMFCRVIEVDPKNYSFKTCALDSMTKKRLDEIGASFWPAPDYVVTKSAIGRGL